jgi:N utilization substance protein A
MKENNFDIKTLLKFIETNYRLDRDTILEIIELSILKAASKNKNFSSDLSVEIDRNDYSVHIYDSFIVDDELKGVGIISSKLAKQYTKNNNIMEGDIVKIEIPATNLGRICARDTRMMILQKIKSTKNNNIINEYKNKVGYIISGIISGFDKGNIIFTTNGNVDMIIPSKEKIINEKYKIGDFISGVIIGINKKQKYSPIIVSRTSELFIEELIRNNIPEINNGKIKIIKIVRSPGFKTKVMVQSTDSKLDAISICVGKNGSRIKHIINEFQREKIDIIHYSENIDDIIKESLAPVKIYDVKHELDSENIFIYTDEESKKILLKKYNKNLYLTSKLIGRKIFVEKYLSISTFEEIKERAIQTISDNLDTSLINALLIVNSGYTTIECIAEEDLETFIRNCNIDEVSASGIHAAAKVIIEHLGKN